ncbi:ABC transporter ATP-binding protein [Sediminispirochaeta smaragdinae]|uniref:ABC transporter related protein n=1 Tax=Sediminispirochaeta smaragdinae (strain DSM 11293 / JCM 15392 / SEBR 4228) TaxID=573413 RepID=E1R9M3_SEDSS|nr:ABC transporter ATP-binding protein [Sediminispirochaeta smaragdinae]ADK83192.1 ABC transporter related protein [Sediminispirochaeta smaragdinae DSM 11293]
MEEEKIVKGYDPVIMRRLLGFVAPYKKLVTIALLAMVLATLAELLGPVILQRSIDQDIINRYHRVSLSKMDDALAERLFAPPVLPQLFHKSDPPLFGDNRFITSSMLERLSAEERKKLFDANIVDTMEWYLSGKLNNAEELLSTLPAEAEAMLQDGWIAMPASSLKKLDKESLGLLRANDQKSLSHKTGVYLIFLIVMLLFSFLQVYLMAYTGQGVMRGLREKLYHHVMSQNLGYLGNVPVGTLVTRVTNDVETINELFTSVATGLLRDFATMGGVIFILFYLDPHLALITSASLPPVVILAVIFRNRARDAYRRVRIWTSKVNAFLSEHISGMDVVQAFHREKRSQENFQKINGQLLSANLAEMYVFATFRPLISLLTSISIGTVLYFGASMVLNSAVSLGVMIAFVNLMQMFYRPVMDFTENFTILQSAMAGGERIFNLLDRNEVIPDNGTTPIPAPVKGKIEFSHVNFGYTNDEQVIRDLSFTIEPGETVAIVGYTGAGKTTIANLLTRLWDIEGGTVLLDGINISRISLSELRSTVVPVQQDVFLFAASIRENITLGRDIPEQRVKAAAETVQSAPFIESLPRGYDTVLSERGANLSTGQRQLLAFTRVVAQNPRVIILDEATGSIDTETEKLIQKAMERLTQGRTSIVIAHRLSTIQHADRIMVLSGGRLVEMGNHAALLAKNGVYANLYRLQYKDAVQE